MGHEKDRGTRDDCFARTIKAMKKVTVCLMLLIVLVCAVAVSASAYTYTYKNTTNFRVRVNVQLYDDTAQKGELAPDASHVISSKALIKSWTAEALLDNKWQQVLNMTCDLLPGDHTFSIYFDEQKDPAGAVNRFWNAIIK